MQTKPNYKLDHLDPLLIEVFQIQNPSDNEVSKALVIEWLTTKFAKFFVEEDPEGNLLFDNRPLKKRGDRVPTIVAHLDQVHPYVRGFRLALLGEHKLVAYDRNGSRVGTGGDDKCGIYVALKMLLSKQPCRAIFVQDEEIGCVGSSAVAGEWGDDSSILIQADRRGNNDLIYHTNGTRIATHELVQRVLALPECEGMKPEMGTLTDVGELCPYFEVQGFNISSGYYDAHTSRESVKLNELDVTLARVAAICKMVGTTYDPLPCYPKPAYHDHSSSYGSGSYESFWRTLCIQHGQSYTTVSGICVGPMRYDKKDIYCVTDKDVVSSLNRAFAVSLDRYEWTDDGESLFDGSLDIQL
jgi:hypothetical protein